MHRERLVFLSIIILASFLRLFSLGKNPPGLYWDEVSLGWNAYSVLKTGMDEHGRFFPIDTFYAFGDYKPPLYIYVTVPSIALFGLNEFAVRLPSALAGIGLVLVTYFLTRELIGDRSKGLSRFTIYDLRFTPLFASFLVAISPWSFTLSRVAFESNLATFFNALGILFFLYSTKKSPWYLVSSVVSFVAAAYTFNSNRILSPLFLLVLSLIFLRTMLRHWKYSLLAIVVGLLLVLPMVGHLQSPVGKLRWTEVNIFSNLDVITQSNERKEIDGNSLLSRVIHHRYIGYTKLFLQHYADHFDLRYLFLTGDGNPRINVPGTGELYLVELPLFVIGLLAVITGWGMSGRFPWTARLLILAWFFLAPIPASMARETPHALRSASVLPIPQIITAIGMIIVNRMISKIRLKKLLRFTIYGLLLTSFLYFQLTYWRYYPSEWASDWMTAYPKLVAYIQSIKQPDQQIYITPDFGRPYVYFLFYTHYDPAMYIREAKAGGRTGDVFGFFSVNEFSQYHFYIPPEQTIQNGDIVAIPVTQPLSGMALKQTINENNGHPKFKVYQK